MIDVSCSFPFPFQSVSLNALDIGLSNETSGTVRIEPAVPPTPTVTIRVSVAHSVIIYRLLTNVVKSGPAYSVQELPT